MTHDKWRLLGHGLLTAILMALVLVPILTPEAQQPAAWTFYPPSVYMEVFRACGDNAACDKTARFHVDPVPKGCCVLTITNGDGRGKKPSKADV